ncbi:hypothetical protein MAR_021642 [Mya arenaria]|uniref:Uncharacterized protein n=1 Tax=Mya arenaria TaxID=6604 RepID=A0ABY7E883_MYAAR|nr:hypothetical protein MAR_021642 [Mya arenaria]
MNVQRLIIAHQQIDEKFSQERNTCLLSDETSKFGRKYQGFHAADEEGNTWCLGVREMSTESVKHSDIVIGQIGEVWESFSEIQKSQLTKLYIFFAPCMYWSTYPSLLPQHCCNTKRQCSMNTLQYMTRAFRKHPTGGDEKSGVHGSFSAYLHDFLNQHKLQSVPLERFRGNRFNILFSSAACVYFLAEEMKEFLEISADNRFLQAVKSDLNTMEYLARCKALRFVFELITKPLWAQIERTDTNIKDIGVVYREVVDYLENLDLHSYLKGTSVMSFVDKDKVTSSIFMKNLLTESPYDDKILIILEIMIPALCGVTKRLFKDHLEVKIWENPGDEIRDKTVATPNNNKFSETVFGVLDRILREQPNVSMIAAESYLVFCHKKTLKWIESKTEKQKEELLSAAHKDVKKMRKNFLKRKNQIEKERKAILNAAL